MSLCIEVPEGQVNKCKATIEAPPKVDTPHHGTSPGVLVFGFLWTGFLIWLWWKWQGKHERNILVGASNHFTNDKERENEKVIKKIIKRRITSVTCEHKDGHFIAQVTHGKLKPRYFKFHQNNVDSVCDNIYYYLTETRTALHSHNFTIETKRVYS